MSAEQSSKILILWTSGEKETALDMVFMYAMNSLIHGWWDEVTVLVWGASTRLAAEDIEVQHRISTAIEDGVRVIACRRCAENLSVTGQLEELGIEVFYTGEFLTGWLRSGDKLLTV